MPPQTVNGRQLLVAVTPDGALVPVKVDALGNLTVSGAGVDSGTQVQIVDGTDPLIKAAVAAGRLRVENQHVQALTDAQLRATPVPVDVTDTQFNVGNFPADYPLPAGQVATLTPQTNALTDVQLRATPVNVETELVQPLTDAQLRATSVLVDTGLAQPLTDAQLRVVPVNVNATLQESTAYVGYVTPGIARKAGEGKLFFASALVAAGAVTTEQGWWQLFNPANSGIALMLSRIIAVSTAPVILEAYSASAGGNQPVTIRNGRFGTPNPTSVANVDINTDTATPGAANRIAHMILGTGIPFILDLPPFLLYPGAYLSVGTNTIPANTSVSIAGFWTEN